MHSFYRFINHMQQINLCRYSENPVKASFSPLQLLTHASNRHPAFQARLNPVKIAQNTVDPFTYSFFSLAQPLQYVYLMCIPRNRVSTRAGRAILHWCRRRMQVARWCAASAVRKSHSCTRTGLLEDHRKGKTWKIYY